MYKITRCRDCGNEIVLPLNMELYKYGCMIIENAETGEIEEVIILGCFYCKGSNNDTD